MISLLKEDNKHEMNGDEINLSIVCILVGSADVRDWHYGDHPRPQVADRGTPSRADKRVAPDREGAADKQCHGEGKLRSQSRGRQRETTPVISQDRISIRISRTCSTAEH